MGLTVAVTGPTGFGMRLLAPPSLGPTSQPNLSAVADWPDSGH
jgi:hypothetical protein